MSEEPDAVADYLARERAALGEASLSPRDIPASEWFADPPLGNIHFQGMMPTSLLRVGSRMSRMVLMTLIWVSGREQNTSGKLPHVVHQWTDVFGQILQLSASFFLFHSLNSLFSSLSLSVHRLFPLSHHRCLLFRSNSRSRCSSRTYLQRYRLLPRSHG